MQDTPRVPIQVFKTLLGVDKVSAPNLGMPSGMRSIWVSSEFFIVGHACHAPWFVFSAFHEALQSSDQIPLLWLQEPQEPDKYSVSTLTSSTDADSISCEQRCQELLSTEAIERDGEMFPLKWFRMSLSRCSVIRDNYSCWYVCKCVLNECM